MLPNIHPCPVPTETAQNKQTIRDTVLRRLADARKAVPRESDNEYRGDMDGGLIFSPLHATNGANGHGKH
jgi:hypothetical protein